MLNINNNYNIAAALEKYPRANELLKKWTATQIAKTHEFLLKEARVQDQKMPEIDEEQLQNTIVAFFQYNPRALYEFFDEHKMPINIYGDSYFGFKPGVDDIEFDEEYKSRFEAEVFAFDKSFELLERKPN